MPEYPEYERRAPDPVQAQIEELILSAEDPKDKAFLLIMNKIASSLDANTHLTQGLSGDVRDLTTAFKHHEEKETAILNQGRGGLQVAIVLLSVIQVIGGFVFSNTLDEIKGIRQELVALQRDVAVNKAGVKIGGNGG